MSQPVNDPRKGDLVAQRYRLLERVAAGGQGLIYRARDERHGDTVAVKILHAQFAKDAHWRQRLMREAQALSLLRNTAAVKVLDQRWSDDGLLCLVMEWLDGTTLEKRLREGEKRGLKLTPNDLLPLLSPVVETLEVAHANSILHRDLKPDNLFVLEDGSIRVIDFGFAKFQRLKSMTATGQIAGSPSYLAPEAWRSGNKDLTRKIDVYAFGVTIFRALAGQPPFRGDPIHLLRVVPTAERPSLHALREDLPKQLDGWVQGALAIEPRERFDSMSACWNAFQIAAGLK